MGKFYALKTAYEPNTAGTNRFMGMLKALSDKGIETNVVFFMSDRNKSTAPAMPHIHYHYLWKKFNVKNNIVKNLLYVFIYSKLFVCSLEDEDVVYLYGCNEMIADLIRKPKVKVYHERTEHPLVSKMKLLNVNKYLNACTHLDGLFVISRGLKKYFRSVGVDEKMIHIINMTVDPSRFRGLKSTPRERYIAYCGKATNNKDGVDQLIKAFAITAKTHPDVKLYIIGSPPDNNDESGNLKLVKSLGIEDKVVFTGVISAANIPQVLLNAEVLALDRPDNIQAKYGFPTKLGEYLLTGKPVVVTNVGDIGYFLKDGESALISKPNSLEDFSNKMNWALDNQQQASIIGERGRIVALKEFNAVIEAEKILTVIFNK